MFSILITHSTQIVQHTRKTSWSIFSHIMYEQHWSNKGSISKVKWSASDYENRIVNSILLEPGHMLIARNRVYSRHFIISCFKITQTFAFQHIKSSVMASVKLLMALNHWIKSVQIFFTSSRLISRREVRIQTQQIFSTASKKNKKNNKKQTKQQQQKQLILVKYKVILSLSLCLSLCVSLYKSHLGNGYFQVSMLK